MSVLVPQHVMTEHIIIKLSAERRGGPFIADPNPTVTSVELISSLNLNCVASLKPARVVEGSPSSRLNTHSPNSTCAAEIIL